MNAAQSFRNLHHVDSLLLLPNAWDAGSARLFESLGAKAIATTSAGVAWARGYADGDVLPIEQLLALTREIARVISVPLSVDIEGGYSDEPAVVAQVVRGVIDAGAVGLNIEDGGGAPDRLCAKIERARQVASSSDVDLFVNARTDVFCARSRAAMPRWRRSSAGPRCTARPVATACSCRALPILRESRRSPGPSIRSRSTSWRCRACRRSRSFANSACSDSARARRSPRTSSVAPGALPPVSLPATWESCSPVRSSTGR